MKKTGVKKGVTADGARQHRAEASVSLRKEKREEGLQKRRNLTVSAGIAIVAASESTAMQQTPTTTSSSEASVTQLPLYCTGEKSWCYVCVYDATYNSNAWASVHNTTATIAQPTSRFKTLLLTQPH